MQADEKRLGKGCVELAYDNSPFYQSCIRQIRDFELEGLDPKRLMASTKTFQLMIDQADIDLEDVNHVYISVLGRPVWVNERVPFRTIFFAFDEDEES